MISCVLRLVLFYFCLFQSFRTNVIEPCSKVCENRVDLVFLVDDSKSIGHEHFETVKLFIANSILNFDIGPKAIQVGLLTFSIHPHTVFKLNAHGDTVTLLNAIHDTKYYNGGETNLGIAIKYVHLHSFNVTSGDRPDAKNVVVIISDGQAHNKAIFHEAQLLKNDNVEIIAIGIGHASLIELSTIATDNTYAKKISSFDSMALYHDFIQSIICRDILATTTDSTPTKPTESTNLTELASVVPVFG